jgi:hypothetical protein
VGGSESSTTDTETTQAGTETETTDSETTDSETTDDGSLEVDPCPPDGCLCFGEPQSLVDAPELAGPIAGLHDLDNDGLRDRVEFAYQGVDALFEAYLATGPDTFAADPTMGPMLEIGVHPPVLIVDVDLDGANDLVFTGGPSLDHGLFIVPADEMWLEELVEHRSEIILTYPTTLTVARLGDDPVASVLSLDQYLNLVEILTLDPETLVFEPRALLGTDLGPTELLTFDLDDDADLDLVTLDEEAQGVSVFLWEAEGFAPPLRLDVPDAAELELLEARGYVLVRGGMDFHALDGSSGTIELEPIGGLGEPPEHTGNIHAVDGGLELLWSSPQYGDHSFFPVCAGPDDAWVRSELPVWLGHDSESDWTLHDVDDDGREDLSLRFHLERGGYQDWRLLRK